jgi:hypothetical protein
MQWVGHMACVTNPISQPSLELSSIWIPLSREVRSYRGARFNLPIHILGCCLVNADRLCGIAVRVPGFDSRRCQIFWEVMGLERGPLSLVRITEELLQWKSSGSASRKSRLAACGSIALTTRHYPQKLALTSPTSGGRSVGIVPLRTKATEFSFFSLVWWKLLCLRHTDGLQVILVSYLSPVQHCWLQSLTFKSLRLVVILYLPVRGLCHSFSGVC